MKIKLTKPFASNGKADEFDTKQIKKALNRLGYYLPYEKTGITGIPDADVFAGLKKFQSDQALQATGTAKPGDETVAALNSEAAKKKSGQYIWRTVEDDKVRASHAAFNGTVRDLADSPDPGEEFNCRCWAEFVSDSKVPIPPRKPNCVKQKKAYQAAQKSLNDLEIRKEKLLEELRELREKLKEIGERMTQALGANIAAFVITIPLDRLGFLAEILRRYFGSIISNELLKNASRLAKERGALIQKAEYKMDQLKTVIEELKRTIQKVEAAKQALEECRATIPGS